MKTILTLWLIFLMLLYLNGCVIDCGRCHIYNITIKTSDNKEELYFASNFYIKEGDFYIQTTCDHTIIFAKGIWEKLEIR